MTTLVLKKFCVIVILFFGKVGSQKVGIHDSNICQKTRTSVSCLHQLPQSIQPSSRCEVEFIEPSANLECKPYHISNPYDPMMLPFNLNLYQFRESIWHSLTFNISFPSPSWKSMSFHIQNQLKPEKHLCRKFNLHLNNSINNSDPYSVFWDCVLFDANIVESQPFSLYLKDENQFGGMYSFRAPKMKQFNSTTNINDWHVFFFIHSYYAETTGKLFVTIQLAPFPDVSYAISSVKCLNNNHNCEHTAILDTVILNNTHFADSNNTDLLVTTRVAAPFEHGLFAVTVQIISDKCNTSGCAVSLSPIYVIKGSPNWSVTAVCLIFGVFIISLSIWVAVRLFLKIHSHFQNYLEKKRGASDTVLIVYHAHSQEYLELIRYFSYLMKCKLCMHPLIIDDNVGTVNPDEWTRILLSSATKVLFIVPNTLNIESTTPIQHQWLCALKYFSGTYFKRQESISSRYATIIFPNSFQLAIGSEIYSLPRFYMPRDLAGLTNWLHRNSILDQLLFWPSIVKKEIGTLSSYINYTINPILNQKPDIDAIAPAHKNIIISEDAENNVYSSQSSIDVNDDELIEKVQKEFDPLIPDIRNIDCDSDNEDISLESDSSCSDSDSCNILNFID